jgi:hypothetical protein
MDSWISDKIKLQKKSTCAQGLDPEFGRPSTRMSLARAHRLTRGGETSEHVCSFFYLSFNTRKNTERTQQFKLGSRHLNR